MADATHMVVSFLLGEDLAVRNNSMNFSFAPGADRGLSATHLSLERTASANLKRNLESSLTPQLDTFESLY